MRIYEITSKSVILEYNRNITLSNRKVKDDLVRRVASGHQRDVQYLEGLSHNDYTIHYNNLPKDKLTLSYPDNVARTPIPSVSYGFLGLGFVNYDLDLVSNMIVKTAFENRITPRLYKYIPWVLREYIRGNVERLEDIEGVDEILTIYEDVKKRRGFPANARDINKLDYPTLRRIVRAFNPNDPSGYSQNMGNYKVLYGEISTTTDEYGLIHSEPKSNVVIIHPLDKTAAIYFGRVFGGLAEWCTAYVPPRTNQFDYYNDKGPMYIIVPREPKRENEKYQIHFMDNQYKNEDDSNIDIGWLLKTRFPEIREIVSEEIEPQLSSFIPLVDELTVEKLMDSIIKIFIDRTKKYYHDKPKSTQKIIDKVITTLNGLTYYDIIESHKGNQHIGELPNVIREIVTKYYDDVPRGRRPIEESTELDKVTAGIVRIRVIDENDIVFNKFMVQNLKYVTSISGYSIYTTKDNNEST